MIPASHRPLRCGIILAAGEGKRLRPLIHRLRGDSLPKQYVNFIGTRSMLEHTFSRAEGLIPQERLFTVVSRGHLGHPEVRRQLSRRSRGTVIVQPENKDTAPGLLLPLVHLYRRYPDSAVVVFPSDHFILHEDAFIHHVDLAFRILERRPSALILLGMRPSGPELEYGYIEPGEKVQSLASWGVCEVSCFIEKPKPDVAHLLVLKGGLWNTLVMVFRVETLLDLVRSLAPDLHRSFQRIGERIGTPSETDVVEEVYRQIEPINFSQGLLEVVSFAESSRLLVLPVRGVFWSDWGSERRIQSVLRQTLHLDPVCGNGPF